MNFQVRIRTDEVFSDMIYIKQWLDECTKGFAFEHSKPDNHHYHIYLFGLQRNPDAMRKNLHKYLKEKVRYSVKTVAGRGNEQKPIDPKIAWQYATEKDLKEPVWVKGFDDMIEVFKFGAEAFYKAEEDRKAKRNAVVTEIMVVNEEKVRPDRVWQRLMEELMLDQGKYDGKKVYQIKSMIATAYLRQLKAVPRPSDLHRYATSLYYIVKHNLHVEEVDIPDDALEDEYRG